MNINKNKNIIKQCDLFCRVIDNYGDAGVCIRLARQLVLNYQYTVRLFCDDVTLLYHLLPSQSLYNLSIYDWNEHNHIIPSPYILCGFGCSLEETYLIAMTQLIPQPVYIHLEYLTAETWAYDTHGLYSTHPRLGLKQRFFNPGFSPKTGGLLHEPLSLHTINKINLINNVNTNTNISINPLKIFFFAYPTPIISLWIQAVNQYSLQYQRYIHWILPYGEAGMLIYNTLKDNPYHLFEQLPWISQTAFDEHLRSADMVWVRGEDSAMTAMWSGLPMLWQLYPQENNEQFNKLKAYLNYIDDNINNNIHHNADNFIKIKHYQLLWYQCIDYINYINNNDINNININDDNNDMINTFIQLLNVIDTDNNNTAYLYHYHISNYFKYHTPDYTYTLVQWFEAMTD